MDKEKTSNFYIALLSFMLMSKHQVVTIGAQHGLTNVQAITLLLVNPRVPQPMSALSETMGCDASNITGLIDGLEQKQLISRHEKTGDRRVKVLHLEPAGAAMRAAIFQELEVLSETHLLGCLTKSERKQLHTLLDKITRGCPLQKAASET